MFFVIFHLEHFSSKYYMIFVAQGRIAVWPKNWPNVIWRRAFLPFQGLRTHVSLVTMLPWVFGAMVAAILSSPSSGPSWKAHVVLPPANCSADRAPSPAVRERAAHIPVPTLPSHRKASLAQFLQRGGDNSVPLGSLEVILTRYPLVSVWSPGFMLVSCPWQL
jgi:hypothetical protein